MRRIPWPWPLEVWVRWGDHFSRYIPEGRYSLHEDYAALRFGFRRLLTGFGLPVTYYVDHGSAFQWSGRAAGRPSEAGRGPTANDPARLPGPATDYLALLRADYGRRTQRELAALRLRTAPAIPELSLVDLVTLLEHCRGMTLSPTERSRAAALWRQLRPLDPEATRHALSAAQRRLGPTLHLDLYLDALTTHLVRLRTKKGPPTP